MLVNCVAYQSGAKLTDVGLEEIHEYLDRPDCFVWVALFDPEPDELNRFGESFGLHDLSVEDARHGQQRPKIEEYGHDLFAVVHTIELDDHEELRCGQVSIFVGSHHVLSVRRTSRQTFVDVRARAEQEPDLLRHGPGYVLYALMDAIVDRYFPVIDTLEREIEAVEERIFEGHTTGAEIQTLYNLKRNLTILRHATHPLLEALGKLQGTRVPVLCAGLQDYFRDVYDHVRRLDQSIDNFRDTVTTAMSVNLSMITIQENEVTKRLASYAAMAAVPTMIAGVYGMNFSMMPELNWTYGYPLVIGIMAAIDGYLFYRFRKAGWL
jgi:magnesium transporter